jgi:endoglucanase
LNNKIFNTVLIFTAVFAGASIFAANSDIRLNSIGYLPVSVKRASIAISCSVFTVNNSSDNSIAFSGTVTGPVSSPDTGESIYTADFSALTLTGSYYMDVPGVGQSTVFPVAINAYNQAYYMAMKGFYLWRCGTAVSYNYPKDGNTYSHAACHMQDSYLDYLGGGHVIQDGTQGWHNAGDYGKYVFDAGATGQMFDAWLMFKDNIIPMPLDVPETAPGLPDFLKEMKWQTDWMLKMQFANNMVSYKISTHDMPVYIMPEADGDRFLAPAGSPETALFTATLAMAARAFLSYDPTYSGQCLNAAAGGYAYLTSNPVDVYADLSSFGNTGLYGENDASLRLWAAAEMWESTGDATALADFETRAALFAPNYVDADFDWIYLKYMGMFTYVLSTRPGKNPALLADISNNIVATADAVVNSRNASAYNRPLGATYYWGSNGTVARQSMLLQVANRISSNTVYMDTIHDAIAYLFGRNMHNRSYVTGVGINPPMYPHHRPSAADGIANPWPGYLVGGSAGTNAPGPTGNDWVITAMPSGLPPAQYWADATDSYSSNEVCNNWQSALVFALAGFVHPETPTFTPTVTATITGTPPTATQTCTASVPNSVNADCVQAVSFVIDGSLNDAAWQTGTWTSVTRVVAGTAGAVSAAYMLKWDNTALYVGVDVADPVLCNTAVNWWEDDDVEIYIDANNDHTLTYGADDFEFTKRYGDPVTHEAHGKLGGVTAETYLTTEGYSVEFSIPWTDLGKTPSAALSMGFDVTVAHKENCSGPTDGVFVWNGNSNNYINTSAFGDVSILACNTATETPSMTPSASVTPTADESSTISPTRTPSVSPTRTLSEIQTKTVSPENTMTATLTPQAAATEAVLRVDDPIIFPNPFNAGFSQDAVFKCGITRPADSIRVKLYTRGFRAVLEIKLPPRTEAGDVVENIPCAVLSSLANGIYYYIVEAEGGGQRDKSTPGMLIFLR